MVAGMRFVGFVLLLLLLLNGCGRKHEQDPLSPAEALKSFRLSDDFHVELFAAEPDVLDPVEIAFDEYGRAYAAEMLDLPDDPPRGVSARSRIRLLEDTNGDGKADRSTIFAEDVLQVSGLLPWKGGLIVPAAPDILYLKDTNGDGKADLRQVLFTGFWQGNPEAQITNPRLGIDNWIYFSNTGNEGVITSPAHPDHPPLQVRGADFRYHPLKGIAEAASGAAQYGSTFDDWGNRFVSQNTIHLRHVVLPRHYLARAPLLPVPTVVNDIYEEEFRERKMYPLTRPQRWRVERTKLRQERYDDIAPGRVEQLAGYITGATGSTVYNGDAFPEIYRGTIFTADVSGNLVRHDIVRPSGVTFLARPAKDGVEFLASTDQWFRPTGFANGPDGLLYMTDMYREFIETPLSVPEELRKDMDFYSGNDKGRIWRIVPNKPRKTRGLGVQLGRMSSAELVKLFEEENGWHRQTAQRLLIERREESALPALREMAHGGRMTQARLHALWTLEGMNALDEGTVMEAMRDESPQIREQALRLSEGLKSSPRLHAAVLAMAKDESLRVRFQVAFTLGNWPSREARQALAALAAEHAADEWMRAAILSSVADQPGAFLDLLLTRGDGWQDPRFVSALLTMIGAGSRPAELSAALAKLARLREAGPALDGLAAGLALSGATGIRAAGVEAALLRYLNSRDEETQKAAWEVARFFELRALVDKARREALNEKLPVEQRVSAVRALRGGSLATARAVAEKIFADTAPGSLQAAIVDTVSSFNGKEAAEFILGRWQGYSPEARLRAVGALLSQRERVPLLLDALENGTIAPSAVEVNARAKLLEIGDDGLIERARRIFREAGGDRAKVVSAYMDVVKMRSDAERGKLAFAEHCGRCHAPQQQGEQVGPNLAGINNKSKAELLDAILNPSAAIESRYVNYLVTAKDGRMYDGILASETPGALTLRGGAEGDVTLLRVNIAEMRASSISLMPEGLEEAMSKQDLADVIAYLRGGL
jgi:putative membrane-bound dehydrogenase-like protein